jgi:phosphate transport system permease protein
MVNPSTTEAVDPTASELEQELRGEATPPTLPVDSFSVPSMTRRGVGAFLEIAQYCLVVMAVAIVEFYSGDFTGPVLFGRKLFETGTPGDFGPSNWTIGLVIYAAWVLWRATRSTTPAGAALQQSFVERTGAPAGFARTMVRNLTKFGAVYAFPLVAFDGNQLLWIALFVGCGFIIEAMYRYEAPWDIVAGTTLVANAAKASPRSSGPLTLTDLQVSGSRQAQDRRAANLLRLAGWVAIIVSLLIVWVVFKEAYVFVSDQDFSFGLLNIEGERKGWYPRRGLFDISTLLIGTLWVTGIAMAIAGPVGLGVAIYLSEYATPRVQRIVKPVIETLASVPSVVIGMFAIFFVSPSLLRFFFDDIGIFSIVAAGIGVGILTIPLVASITEDALRAVPRSLREAAYGLGARKITVALKVVFPAALSGISAAFIVGVSRAIGETMVVAIAAGGSGGTLFGYDPLVPGQTVTAAMASLGAGTDQVAGSGLAFQSLYFLGALLFLLTLALNVISDAIVRRFREVY